MDRPDGLLLSKDGKQLVVVNNAGGGEGKVLSFISNDEWESGSKTVLSLQDLYSYYCNY